MILTFFDQPGKNMHEEQVRRITSDSEAANRIDHIKM